MKKHAVTLITTAALLVPLAAVAQEAGLEQLTSQEPLQRLVEGFEAGDSLSGYLQTNPDEGPIVSSIQFVVNLGPTPAFSDTDLVPVGFQSDTLVSMAENLPEPLASVPPLHPWGSNDISPLFSGWTAYGEQGAIAGPIAVSESPTLVWGVSLSEPFDQSCAEDRSVGRAWTGESLTSADLPFTADLLAEALGGNTHEALADGENTRLLELACRFGGEPQIFANRGNAERGTIRPFGPVPAFALVKDNHVLFMMAERILGISETDIDPAFYANDPGGDVAVFDPVADVPALVPNPYDDLPIRFDLELDPEEEASIVPQSRNLLFTGEAPSAIRVGPKCPVSLGGHFLEPLSAEDQANLRLFVGTLSLWADASISGGIATFDVVHPDGSVETKTIDFNTGRWGSAFVWGPGSGEANCDLEGPVSLTAGSIPGVSAAEPPPAAEGGTADDEDEPSDLPGPVASEPTPSGGFPWVVVLLGLAAAGGGYLVWERTRTRTRRPEGGSEPGPGDPGVVTPPPPIGTRTRDPEESIACDWAVYVVEAGGKRTPLKQANGNECCVYTVKIETKVASSVIAMSGRQDVKDPGQEDRLRLPHADIRVNGLAVRSVAQARSGPADTLQWMQGLGDLGSDYAVDSDTPPSSQTRTLEQPSDVASHVEHDEHVVVEVSLEGGCQGHLNRYETNSTARLAISPTHECTNAEPGHECPVELAAPATATAEAQGDTPFTATVSSVSDPDELDQFESLGHALTDSHDHETRDRTLGREDAIKGAGGQFAVVQGNLSRVVLRSKVDAGASIIVPTQVWDTTQRVTAGVELSIVPRIRVTGEMARGACANGAACHGNTECNCDPSVTVVVGTTARITGGDRSIRLRRPWSGVWSQ